MPRRPRSGGLDSLWASDHIVIPELKTSQYPGRASGQFPLNWLEGYWEPFTALSYIAAITKKITLGTSVLIMPMRNPIEVARNVADLDQLAEGRFVFGVGMGCGAEALLAAVGEPRIRHVPAGSRGPRPCGFDLNTAGSALRGHRQRGDSCGGLAAGRG